MLDSIRQVERFFFFFEKNRSANYEVSLLYSSFLLNFCLNFFFGGLMLNLCFFFVVRNIGLKCKNRFRIQLHVQAHLQMVKVRLHRPVGQNYKIQFIASPLFKSSLVGYSALEKHIYLDYDEQKVKKVFLLLRFLFNLVFVPE